MFGEAVTGIASECRVPIAPRVTAAVNTEQHFKRCAIRDEVREMQGDRKF
jgi:hypothetical protein